MKNFCFYAGLFLLGTFYSLPLSAVGGLEPSILHGSRHGYLGGGQIGIEGDVYSLFYNPAGLAELKKSEFAINTNNWFFSYEAPLEAHENQRKSEISWGPFFFVGAAHPINNVITIGFALFPTHSLGGTFKHVDFGPMTDRSYENRLVRIEAAPSVSFNLNENFSIGASWKISYTEFNKKVGTFNGLNSSRLSTTLYNWDFKGFKMGALLHTDDFRFALTYRFENPIQLDGKTEIETALNLGAPDSVDTKQKITLPQQFQVGLSYEWIPDRFMSAFAYEYTHSEVLKYDAPELDPSSPYAAIFTPAALRTPLEWNNSHSLHFGSEYTFLLASAKKVRLGAGIAYDIAVARDKNPNPILPPSANYLGFTLGSQYLSGANTYGLAFSYGQYGDRTSLAELNPELIAKSAVFAGKYELKIFTASFDYKVSF